MGERGPRGHSTAGQGHRRPCSQWHGGWAPPSSWERSIGGIWALFQEGFRRETTAGVGGPAKRIGTVHGRCWSQWWRVSAEVERSEMMLIALIFTLAQPQEREEKAGRSSGLVGLVGLVGFRLRGAELCVATGIRCEDEEDAPSSPNTASAGGSRARQTGCFWEEL